MNEHRVITAELRRHDFQISGDEQMVRGFVYSNPRFREGEYIRRGPVKRIEGDLVFTDSEIFRILN